MNEVMTTDEFKKLIDHLEDEYREMLNDGFDGSVLELLDDEIGSRDFYLHKINYLDVIRELHKCNMNCNIICDGGDGEDDPDYECTPRFKILMGICECIEYCNRPQENIDVEVDESKLI